MDISQKNNKTLFLVFTFLLAFSSLAQNNVTQRLNVMPWPSQINENGNSFVLDKQFTISIPDKNNQRITKYTTRFIKRLAERTGIFINKPTASVDDNTSSLRLTYNRIGKLEINEDESYELVVSKTSVKLHATTDIGVLRGLETLLQLVSNSEKEYYFTGVSIKDKPRFTWRGLLIDVSRHFEPIPVLKRNLQAMAAVKMNVFHWHLTDDQGFRVEIKSRPKFHELASDGDYYTQKEIVDLVQFAADLGIRVVPEFDVPAHATSWLVAYPEIGSKENHTYSIERNSGIFNPTLDPTNPKTYEIIADVFAEMAVLFPDAYFHIGGDENKGKHWNSNKKIQSFMKEYDLKNNHELQTYFNIEIQKILKKNNKIMMGWDEIFQDNLPKDVVIHSWRGNKSMIKAASLGYKTVLSQGYYIDLLLPASKHYKNDPLSYNTGLTTEQAKNVLGGEATMWGELVTPLTIDSRIWPRTAAIAERLWSPQTIQDEQNMYKRLEVISQQLENIGITHIRNRDVILRNITDNQNINALIDLIGVCEPLKGYTRNKGGTKYKTYSPFTLFADACTADAYDALQFKYQVDSFIKNKDDADLKQIKNQLLKWSLNYSNFKKLESNPKLEQILPLSILLSDVSKQFLEILDTKDVSEEKNLKIKATLKEMDKPYADVELVIVNSLNKLLDNK